LRDALQVNPYDVEQTAEAIRAALEMDPEERQSRMQHMRRAIREHNIYEWAGNLIAKLCELRIENVENESTRLGASAA
jgi:trehalose 6-phosphate synthase